jgi:hypothetical protein
MVGDPFSGSRRHVVDDDDSTALVQKSVDEVRTDETSSTGNDDRLLIHACLASRVRLGATLRH